MKANPIVPPIPDGYDEVLKVFGNIGQFIRGDGTLMPTWEGQNIVRIDLPAPLPLSWGTAKVRQVAVHRKLAPLCAWLFYTLHQRKLWADLENFGGGFNFRTVRGRVDKLSLHSFGIAFDFDVHDNQLGSTKPGTMNAKIVSTFEEFGFLWGGKYQGRKDPMHFQYAVNC